MDPIYVTGHRNPDTDSIVSAMAYAALRNALGDREYRAARLGHVSDETQLVLDRFGFPAPVWIKTMRTQVRDLDYDTPPALSSGVTISRAWAALSTDTSIAALPITNEDGTLFGMLSSGDIAASDITFYRLQCDSEGVLRAYVAQGEVLDVPTRSFGGIGVFAIPEMGRFYRHVLIEKRYPHHGAVAFGHYGKALFEVMKYR